MLKGANGKTYQIVRRDDKEERCSYLLMVVDNLFLLTVTFKKTNYGKRGVKFAQIYP